MPDPATATRRSQLRRTDSVDRLIQAIQQRDAVLARRLVEVLVHRRGVEALRSVCATTIPEREGVEAAAWLERQLVVPWLPSGAGFSASRIVDQALADYDHSATVSSADPAAAVSSAATVTPAAPSPAAAPAAPALQLPLAEPALTPEAPAAAVISTPGHVRSADAARPPVLPAVPLSASLSTAGGFLQDAPAAPGRPADAVSGAASAPVAEPPAASAPLKPVDAPAAAAPQAIDQPRSVPEAPAEPAVRISAAAEPPAGRAVAAGLHPAAAVVEPAAAVDPAQALAATADDGEAEADRAAAESVTEPAAAPAATAAETAPAVEQASDGDLSLAAEALADAAAASPDGTLAVEGDMASPLDGPGSGEAPPSAASDTPDTVGDAPDSDSDSDASTAVDGSEGASDDAGTAGEAVEAAAEQPAEPVAAERPEPLLRRAPRLARVLMSQMQVLMRLCIEEVVDGFTRSPEGLGSRPAQAAASPFPGLDATLPLTPDGPVEGRAARQARPRTKPPTLLESRIPSAAAPAASAAAVSPAPDGSRAVARQRLRAQQAPMAVPAASRPSRPAPSPPDLADLRIWLPDPIKDLPRAC